MFGTPFTPSVFGPDVFACAVGDAAVARATEVERGVDAQPALAQRATTQPLIHAAGRSVSARVVDPDALDLGQSRRDVPPNLRELGIEKGLG